jgi:hypothetical protein
MTSINIIRRAGLALTLAATFGVGAASPSFAASPVVPSDITNVRWVHRDGWVPGAIAGGLALGAIGAAAAYEAAPYGYAPYGYAYSPYGYGRPYGYGYGYGYDSAPGWTSPPGMIPYGMMNLR